MWIDLSRRGVKHAAWRSIGAIALLAVSAGVAAMDAPAAPTPAPPSAINTARLNLVMRAAVQKYPALIHAAAQGGTYNLSIVVRADGTIYDSDLHFSAPAPGPIAMPAGLDTLKDLFLRYPTSWQAVFEQGQAVADVGKASDVILASWLLLPEDFDESRAPGRVADALLAQYSNFLRPTTDMRDRTRTYTDINLVTVLMTEDGQIARETVESKTIKDWESMNPRPTNTATTLTRVYTPPLVPAEAFKVLGVDPEQVGQTGLIVVTPPIQWFDSGAPYSRERAQEINVYMESQRYHRTVLVRYAWPRRPGEPIGDKAPSRSLP